MENTENQGGTSLKRKIFITLVLFGFLVILPVGSWFYLKKGADFRMAQLEELKTKATLDFDAFKANYGNALPNDSFTNRAILIGKAENEDLEQLKGQLTNLEEQYAGSELINIVLFSTNETVRDWAKEGGDFPKIYFVEENFNSSLILNPIDQEVPNDFSWALIDNKGAVRNYYSADDFTDLIVQTAIILPTPKRAKIDLER
ncbi:MAG: hypothetical protein R2879_21055 [Saprospiraceae bacterium]